MTTIRQILDDNSKDTSDLYRFVSGTENYNKHCDSLNDREVIEMYITEMMQEGVHVSHILRALEESNADFFEIWLGNSMETPRPINTKQELVDFLEFTDEELDTEPIE